MQTIDQIIATHAAQKPNVAVFSYPSIGTNFVDYTALDLETKAQRLAKRYSEFLPKRPNSEAPREVVAVLANSNLDYVITIMALSKLGLTTLLLSTRISDEAYRHLLNKTGCSYIVLQDSFKQTIERGVKGAYEKPVITVSMDECARALYDESLDSIVLNVHLDPSKESETPVWIIHSSGSTGLPKPISLTNKSVMASINSTGKWFQQSGLVTLPLFHLYGTISLFGGIYAGKKVFFHNCQLPLTGQNILEELKLAKPAVLQSVPYVLKLLTETPDGIEEMRKLDYVYSAGSATPQELGTSLVKQGIKIMNFYGSYALLLEILALMLANIKNLGQKEVASCRTTPTATRSKTGTTSSLYPPSSLMQNGVTKVPVSTSSASSQSGQHYLQQTGKMAVIAHGTCSFSIPQTRTNGNTLAVLTTLSSTTMAKTRILFHWKAMCD
jgi:acyl-CoA synthetase (AMP-forming)/AMP-acid ligase II